MVRSLVALTLVIGMLSACGGQANPPGSSAPGTTEDKYASFRREMLLTVDRLDRAAATAQSAPGPASLVGWADAMDQTITDALMWLDSHPATDCYRAYQDAYRAELLFMRKMPPVLRDFASGSAAAASAMEDFEADAQRYGDRTLAAKQAVDPTCK